MDAGGGLGCVENGGSNSQFSFPVPDLTRVSALRKGLYWIMQADLGAMAGGGGGLPPLTRGTGALVEKFGESLVAQSSIFGSLHTPQASN